MKHNIKNWFPHQYKKIQDASLFSFLRIDNPKKRTPAFILYKTIQPLVSLPKLFLGIKVELPIGRMYNIDNQGVRCGYLFELPKLNICIEENYFFIFRKMEEYSNVRVAFMTPHFSVFAPEDGKSMLIVNTEKNFIDINRL